jgi:hypothetical protein
VITITKWADVNMETNPSHSFEMEKVLEGILVAKQENVGPNNSKLFTIEKSKSHDKVSVWGSAVLDKLFTLPIGSLVRIEYLGKEKGKKGTMFKNYKIQIDEDTRPVTAEDADAILNG